MKMLESKYKFYLSFENSFCDDYVTEKFFKVLNYDMIPIVLGGGNYSKFAPAKSFIDAKDFKSIADLAEHIKYLDKNETAYSEYFEWKTHFRVVSDYSRVFCQLCQALNDPAGHPEKTYSDIFKWWRTQAHCIKKGRFPWSKTALESYVDYFKSGATQIASLLSQSKLVI
jgi:alpha-1,3-fucosyltransferase